MEKVAVYLHWPFCVAKCPYCDFVSYKNDARAKEFEQVLFDDLKLTMSKLNIKSVSSIFFGGGTPSLLSAQIIEQIIDYLSPKAIDNIEISLEANPATFNEEKLKNLKSAGINRLSLGVQSFEDKNLKFLGRIYSEEQAKKSASLVAKYFENFSFDLMYGYQSITDIENDLITATDFGVKHISCYQLTLEPGTPFYAKFINDKNFLAKSEENYMKYIENILNQHNIFRYEISNFARQDYESKHNLTYWNYGNYVGCGASAHSRLMIDNEKHATTKPINLKQWQDNIGNWSSDVVLSYEEQLEEIIIMGLRKIHGIDLNEIPVPYEIVKKIITDDKLTFLIEHDLIYNETNKIHLTPNGLLKVNSIIRSLLDD